MTCKPKGWRGFFLQDASSGLYCEPIDFHAERDTQPLNVGDAVEVRGVIQRGTHHPYLAVTDASPISTDLSIAPYQLRLTEINNDHDAIYISVRGYIKNAVMIAGELNYTIASRGIELDVVHEGFWTEINQDLRHACVEVRGVFFPNFGREQTGSSNLGKIIVQSQKEFRIVKEAAAIEQEAAQVPIAQLIHSKPKEFENLVRIEGDVTLISKDAFWVVRDEASIQVRNHADSNLLKNRTIEAVGMISSQSGKIGFESANVLVERLTQQAPLRGRQVSAIDDSLPVGTIVDIEGDFIHLLQLGSSPLLVFESTSGELHVKLPPETKRRSLNQFTPESRFRIQGILDRETSNPGEPAVPVILVRGPNDIILQTSGGWSKKALWSMIIALVITLAGITFTAIVAHIQLHRAESELRELEERIARE